MSSASIERKVHDFVCYGLELRVYQFYDRELTRYFETHDDLAPTADDLAAIEARREEWEAKIVAKYRKTLEKREAERRERVRLWRLRQPGHAA